METLIHADIFFFITSIAVVILTILLAVILAYAIIVFRNLKKVSEQVKRQAQNLETDIDTLRQCVKSQGLGLKLLFKLKDLFKSKIKKRKN